MKKKRVILIIEILLIFWLLLSFSLIRVEGNSMEDTMYENDLALYLKTDKVKVGDIIVLDYKGKRLIKRLVGKNGMEFLNSNLEVDEIAVMGDNIDSSFDSFDKEFRIVYEKDILGKIIKIFH
jgi:signal peptidase I